jgi:DNA-binding MarR family transcriptional regulator
MTQGMTVKELIEFLMVSRQNLTAVLNRLEASGLVERTRVAEDGRIRRVRLTSKGAATWARMLVNIRAYYAAATADFTAEEGLLLFRLLDRLMKRLSRL